MINRSSSLTRMIERTVDATITEYVVLSAPLLHCSGVPSCRVKLERAGDPLESTLASPENDPFSAASESKSGENCKAGKWDYERTWSSDPTSNRRIAHHGAERTSNHAD